MKTTVHWFRKDLRVSDNTGLSKAFEDSDRVVPVFIWDPEWYSSKDWGAPRLQCLLEGLKSLQANLNAKGHTLIFRTGKPEELLPVIVRDSGADSVYCNREYEPAAAARDLRVSAKLKERGMGFKSFKDAVVWENEEILNQSGKPYTVFTPYSKNWLQWEIPKPLATVNKIDPEPAWLKNLQTEALPESIEAFGMAPFKLPVPFGEKAALNALRDFIDNRVGDYHEKRNSPSENGTSMLSAHLNLGTLNVRTIIQALRPKLKNPSQGPLTFRTELIWREFYIQIMSLFPHVVQGAFRSQYDDLAWLNYENEFEAWKQGRTGYPIVDAAMRCLNQTGWMHNRLRMIVAMFLTKDLLINWQWGEAYFMQRLMDADLAANNGGWQWSAGTGTDAAPYFRIFNPVSQGEKFDPKGVFVKKWVPELLSFPMDAIHQPWKKPLLLKQSGYCERIILHEDRRSRCLEMFKKVKAPVG